MNPKNFIPKKPHLIPALFLSFSLMTVPSVAADLASESLVSVQNTGASMVFTPQTSYGSFDLRINGPEGIFLQQEGNVFQAYDANGNLFPDGQYGWELRLGPVLTEEMVKARRTTNRTAIETGVIETGAFQIANGLIIAGNEVEEFVEVDETQVAPKTQVINEVLVVQDSTCIGGDCTNSESFGFDTLRFRENNLRIHFDDTSSSTGNFPSNDWRLTTNDSSNGGASYFAIEDATGGKTPFRVDAGSPNNSLYVDSDGHVGIGTSSPGFNLHVVEGNSPALRLEQDGSNGFTSQIWDLSGNETNFFLRNTTNSSDLPFRVHTTAGQNNLVLRNSRVGIGLNNPSTTLQVRTSADTTLLVEGNGSSSTADLTVEGDVSAAATVTSAADATLDVTGTDSATMNIDGDTATFNVTADDTATFEVINSNGTSEQRQLMTLTNNGGVRFTLKNTTGQNWDIGSEDTGDFVINVPNNGSTQLRMDGSGNVTTSGTVNGTSDRNMKRGFAEINAQEVLAKVVEMPLTTWNYRADDASIRHLGPMAQDFYAAFELGVDERHISYSDLGGVALAAIQGLNGQVGELEEENRELKERLAALEMLVAKLAGE